MWCSRCQSAWYCSPEHLQGDWQRHRRECIPASANQQTVIATPPPIQEQLITVSAILFVAEEERSRIVPIQCRPAGPGSPSACPVPLVHEYFLEGPPSTIVLTTGLNGEPLRFPLHIFYCPTSLQRGAPINRGIYRITSGAAARPWCGTVVVLKFNGTRRQGYSDAGGNDLPALSAYFLAFK
ncbi:unnamed protein product [Somion occarium]